MIQAIKFYKKDMMSLAALCALVLGLILIITGNENIFASTTDWPSQHSAFLEYFRQLFYESGELLPSFAPNIGMGQNIFNFAYYGLLSPYVLIYFLFPFLRPEPYVITLSIASALVSVMLFYLWLRYCGRTAGQALFSAVMLALAAPFLFHSHRHVMFVIYMPFLVGALFGAERYIRYRKFGLLVIMCALMIFTSFYYSPMALLCVLTVALYRFMKFRGKVRKMKVFLFALKICLLILLGVALAAVLLLPTAYALFSGRSGAGASSFEISFLFPQVAVTELLYDPYSLGMTAIFPAALILGLFSRKKHVLFLSGALCVLMFFPVTAWAANGTLYLDGKVLIPLLPAAIVLIGEFFESVAGRAHGRSSIYLIFALAALSGSISVLLLGGTWHLVLLFLFDVCACTVFVHMSYLQRNVKPLMFYTLAFMLCVCLSVNFAGERLVKTQDLKKDGCTELKELSDIAADRADNLWRTGINNGSLYHVNRVSSTEEYKTTVYSSAFNRSYNDCFYGIFNCEVQHRNASIQNNSLNFLFNTFAAQKYMISKNDPGAGYVPVATRGEYTLYENSDTLPFAWFSDRTLSVRTFEKLSYPACAEALVKYAVCRDGAEDTSALSSSAVDLTFEELERANVKIEGDAASGITVTAGKGARMKLALPGNEHDLLFIRFTLDPSQKEWQGDRAITVNGVKNKLTSPDSRYHNGNYTFDYAVSSNRPIAELDISFTRGVYKISNIEFYTLDRQSVKASVGAVTPFEVDLEATKGDLICGEITAPDDGKLVFSIPYDRGFTVTVDGIETEYETANGGFICVDMTSGRHTVELSYRAPLLDAGIAVSSVAALVFAVMLTVSGIYRRAKRKTEI